MRDNLRIHYHFILGAFGGLNGWFLSAVLLPMTNSYDLYIRQAVLGATIGSSISGMLAAYNIISSRPLVGILYPLCSGFVRGALAGSVALVAAQFIYTTVPDMFEPSLRPVTLPYATVGVGVWILFGGLIGFGAALSKVTRPSRGLLGGLLGGAAAGLIYELGRAHSLTGPFLYEQQIFLAFTLASLGGVIGVFIALSPATLKSAWIEVLSGELAGRRYDITKYVTSAIGARKPCIIGSDELSANVYLPADSAVLPRHAAINNDHGIPTLSTFLEAERSGGLLINGKRVTRVSLNDGDHLQMGSTLLRYRHKYR